MNWSKEDTILLTISALESKAEHWGKGLNESEFLKKFDFTKITFLFLWEQEMEFLNLSKSDKIVAELDNQKEQISIT